MGDFNTVFENDTQMLQFCRKDGLVDGHYERYKTRDFATYSRGKTRIDFCLIYQNVYNAVIDSGYTAFVDMFHSDYCSQFTTLSRKVFFSSASHTLPKYKFFQFQTSRQCMSVQYVHSLYNALIKVNIFSKVSTLSKAVESNHHMTEELDSKLLSLSLEARKQIPHRSSYDYSPELTKLCVTVKLLKLHLSALKTSIYYKK